MKNAISFLFLVSLTFQGNSQSVSLSVLGSVGGGGTAGSVNINYTAGEAFVATLDSGSLVLTQGFHQPYYIITAVEETFPGGAITVFPNPTAFILQVQFKDIELENLVVAISDISGRSISTSKVDTDFWQTDLSGLANGYYLLTITDVANRKTNSFKILKSN